MSMDFNILLHCRLHLTHRIRINSTQLPTHPTPTSVQDAITPHFAFTSKSRTHARSRIVFRLSALFAKRQCPPIARSRSTLFDHPKPGHSNLQRRYAITHDGVPHYCVALVFSPSELSRPRLRTTRQSHAVPFSTTYSHLGHPDRLPKANQDQRDSTNG